MTFKTWQYLYNSSDLRIYYDFHFGKKGVMEKQRFIPTNVDQSLINEGFWQEGTLVYKSETG